MMTELNYYPDPPRGCGRKRPGFYLEGMMGSGGTLSAWTWLLGTHTDDGINCLTDVPARSIVVGNLPASLVVGERIPSDMPLSHVLADDAARRRYDEFAAAMPKAAIFDYVGKKYYTPWEFGEETALYGPSRRVPESVARSVAFLAASGPVPIVFCYDMPIVAIEERDAIMDLAFSGIYQYGESRWTQPTWLQPGFSLYSRDAARKDGWEHWLVGLLYLEHLYNAGGVTDERLEIARRLFGAAPRFQTPFGVSWINRVSHARPPGDDSNDEALWRSGIDTIVLDE